MANNLTSFRLNLKANLGGRGQVTDKANKELNCLESASAIGPFIQACIEYNKLAKGK